MLDDPEDDRKMQMMLKSDSGKGRKKGGGNELEVVIKAESNVINWLPKWPRALINKQEGDETLTSELYRGQHGDEFGVQGLNPCGGGDGESNWVPLRGELFPRNLV